MQNGFDINFAEADISHAVVCGENVLQYRLDYYQHDGVHFALFDPLATESVVNCLYYDTHIENTYIQGDFTVDGNLEISKRNGKLPPLTSKLYENGYPFFSGDLTLCGSYIYDGVGDCVLKLDGRFIAAEVTVNGVRTDFAMDFKKDITSLLKKGENRISVHLHSGLRNLLGPHHYAPVPEPIAVSPVTFTMRKAWNGGIAPNYTPVYQSVPFGVDTVQILKTI